MTGAVNRHRLVCCREALGRLLEQYAPMVRSICANRLGCTHCDDLQQEAFLRVLKNCHRVRDSRHLPAYLRTITKNLCTDRIRARRSEPRIVQADDHTLENLADPWPEGSDSHEDPIEGPGPLHDAIAHLPTTLRTVLEMFYFRRLDYAAIADETGLSIAAIGQRLSRARRRLRMTLSSPRRAG